jgi:hypothetical protein
MPQSSIIPASYCADFFYRSWRNSCLALIIARLIGALMGASVRLFAQISIYSFANYG